MFIPAHFQTRPDPAILRAARMGVQHHPAILVVRLASAEPSASGCFLWTRFVRIGGEARS